MDHEKPKRGTRPAGGPLDGATLTWGLVGHRWVLAPRVRAQLERRRGGARRIPDPVLRGAALGALEGRRANAEAVAVFALLAPRRRRAAALRAIVSLQVAVDYLDALEEAGADVGGRPADGGYLTALERESRETAASLPSYGRVSPLVTRAVERCKGGQRRTHAAAASGDPAALRAWAEGLGKVAEPRIRLSSPPAGKVEDGVPAGEGYLWWEVAAGASSSVAAHALIAAAADPRTSAAEAEAIDAAYFPPVGALTVLLDDLVDRAADAAAGEHNHIAYYGGEEAAAERLALLVLRARAAIAPLRRRPLHAAILAGVVGFYAAALPARRARCWRRPGPPPGRSPCSRGAPEMAEPPARHVAIITDGNGRWARARGLSVGDGHRAGAETVRKRLHDAAEWGIAELTVYAFSTENWQRSPEEVRGLVDLLASTSIASRPSCTPRACGCASSAAGACPCRPLWRNASIGRKS